MTSSADAGLEVDVDQPRLVAPLEPAIADRRVGAQRAPAHVGSPRPSWMCPKTRQRRLHALDRLEQRRASRRGRRRPCRSPCPRGGVCVTSTSMPSGIAAKCSASSSSPPAMKTPPRPRGGQCGTTPPGGSGGEGGCGSSAFGRTRAAGTTATRTRARRDGHLAVAEVRPRQLLERRAGPTTRRSRGCPRCRRPARRPRAAMRSSQGANTASSHGTWRGACFHP